MTRNLELKIIDELKKILNNYNVINSEDVGFKSLICNIEKHFVLDWYTKDSVKASIRSEIRRYLFENGLEKDVIIEVLNEISMLLEETKKGDKQETQIEDEKILPDEVKSFPKKEIKMALEPKHYTIILDSNYLYNSYKSGGDFRKFTLNSPFHKLLEKIEKFDIYNYVNIAIPEVVHNEIIMQRIEKLRIEVNKILEVVETYTLPEDILEVKISNRDDYYKKYEDLVREESEQYINEINKGSTVRVIEIPFRQCSLENISKRAFYKQPPFEGKDKKSDKGFKDALIWESILEYKKSNPSRQIVFLSEDKEFNEFLILEFKKLFEDEIYIVKKEDESTILEQIVEEASSVIGEIPITKVDTVSYYDNLNILFYDWYNSQDFEKKLTNDIDEYIETTEKFIKFNKIIDKEVKSLENIDEEKIILIIDCDIELENKKIAGEKFEVLERFELKIITNEDFFEIENITNLDYKV